MARFTLPRDVYHGKGCLSELKNLKGKKAVLVVGGGKIAARRIRTLLEFGCEITVVAPEVGEELLEMLESDAGTVYAEEKR